MRENIVFKPTFDVYLIESETGRFSMTWSGRFSVSSQKTEHAELFEQYLKHFSSEERRSERSIENGEKPGDYSIYDSFWGKTIAVFERIENV